MVVIQRIFDAIFRRLPLLWQLAYLRVFDKEAFEELERLHEEGWLEGNRSFRLSDTVEIVVTTERVLVREET